MSKLELIKALAVIAVVLVGLSAGLAARPADVAWLWRRPGLLGRSLFAAVAVMPVVVMVVLSLVPLPRETQASLVTLAIVPAAPLAIGKSAKQGGHAAYAVSLEITLILLMVLTIPLLQMAFSAVFHFPFTLGVLYATKRAVVTQVLPLAVGLFFAWRWPAGSARLGALAGKIATAVLIALFLVIVVASARVMLGLGAASYLSMALVAAIVVLAAHTVGGPEPDSRRTLAIFSVLHHPGLAILLVTLNAPELKVAPAVLAYLIVASVVLAVYHRFAGATSGEPQQRVLRPHLPHR
jgi:BASS family bile acid:Na+ symporter